MSEKQSVTEIYYVVANKHFFLGHVEKKIKKFEDIALFEAARNARWKQCQFVEHQ